MRRITALTTSISDTDIETQASPDESRESDDAGNETRFEPHSHIGQLQAICRDATFEFQTVFNSPDGVAYAQVRQQPDGSTEDGASRTELFELDTRGEFGLWLTDAAHERHRFIPTPDELERVIRLMRAKARKRSNRTPRRRVTMASIPVDVDRATRAIQYEERLFIDQCDGQGHVIQITAHGWDVIQPRYVPSGTRVCLTNRLDVLFS